VDEAQPRWQTCLVGNQLRQHSGAHIRRLTRPSVVTDRALIPTQAERRVGAGGPPQPNRVRASSPIWANSSQRSGSRPDPKSSHPCPIYAGGGSGRGGAAGPHTGLVMRTTAANREARAQHLRMINALFDHADPNAPPTDEQWRKQPVGSRCRRSDWRAGGASPAWLQPPSSVVRHLPVNFAVRSVLKWPATKRDPQCLPSRRHCDPCAPTRYWVSRNAVRDESANVDRSAGRPRRPAFRCRHTARCMLK
jgi:hypothetical protein